MCFPYSPIAPLLWVVDYTQQALYNKHYMDIHKKFRLIGFYNKPNQNMYEELVFVKEASELAKLLGSSLNSIVSNKDTDPLFRSIIKSNTVFIFKNEDNELAAYYPYKGIARLSDVRYEKGDINQVPLMYKRWFTPGEDIRLIAGKGKHPDSSDGYFTLPDDLFEMPTANNDAEYIGVVNEKYRNPKAIAKMIDYFAETHRISNDIATKKSFAFRLTGRCRPEEECMLERIHWQTEDTEKLFHMCQKLFDSGKKGNGKYEKMKSFFIADNDPKFESKGSAFAARAGVDFEDKIRTWFSA